jgi:hypothetical protein
MFGVLFAQRIEFLPCSLMSKQFGENKNFISKSGIILISSDEAHSSLWLKFQSTKQSRSPLTSQQSVVSCHNPQRNALSSANIIQSERERRGLVIVKDELVK